MPIDWNKFGNDLDAAVNTASGNTDAKLSSIMSSVTRLTNDEIEEMFPQPADVQKLFDLMKIVKSAEEQNNKINQIVANAEEFGGIILKLLDKFA